MIIRNDEERRPVYRPFLRQCVRTQPNERRRTAPIKKKRVFPLRPYLPISFLSLSQAEPVGGGGGMSRTVEGVARRGGWQASRARRDGGRLCERWEPKGGTREGIEAIDVFT